MNNLRTAYHLIGRHERSLIALVAATGTLAVLFVAYCVLLYQRPVIFGYDQPTCISDITPLPRLLRSGQSRSYRAQTTRTINVLGYPLVARTTCIRAIAAPEAAKPEVTRLGLLGSTIVAKRYAVTATKRPEVRSTVVLSKPLSIKGMLKLSLDTTDVIHNYAVLVGGKRQSCDLAAMVVSCDIAKLGLSQGRDYRLELQQYFGRQKVATVAAKTVRTALPVTVVRASVGAQAVIYDKPDKLVLEADQNLTATEVQLEAIAADGKRNVVTTKTNLAGNAATVTFAKPLDREIHYELTMKTATSKDNGFLENPYVLPFTTSASPKVQRINIGSRSVDQYASLVVTFDQPLKPGVNYAGLVALSSGASALATTVSVSGNVLTIRPQTPFGLCGKIKLRLDGDVANAYDVSGKLAWVYDSRAICYTVSVIGASSAGRSIQAYRFGSGSSKVLYLGTTHGDERGTKSLMDTWINELETNPDRIPANRTIIVIPNLNPDGYAANNRRNAHSVDLNRNFPANNWKSDVIMPGGQLQIGGGGSQPLSEPESQALAQFTQAEQPRLTLTYHSIGSVVQPNGAVDSSGLAATYSASSGYGILAPGVNAAFQYDTTGAFEDWMYDKLQLPVLLIELSSHTSSEWSRNSAAMWKMAQLP